MMLQLMFIRVCMGESRVSLVGGVAEWCKWREQKKEVTCGQSKWREHHMKLWTEQMKK